MPTWGSGNSPGPRPEPVIVWIDEAQDLLKSGGPLDAETREVIRRLCAAGRKAGVYPLRDPRDWPPQAAFLPREEPLPPARWECGACGLSGEPRDHDCVPRPAPGRLPAIRDGEVKPDGTSDN